KSDNRLYQFTEDDNGHNTVLLYIPTQEVGVRSCVPNPALYQNLPGNEHSWGVFGSAHPAGVNALFGDGSVHNVKFGVDPDVFNALGNMDDGTQRHVSDDY